MEALLARAEAEPEARGLAEARLGDLSVALRERRRVLQRRDEVLAAMEDLEARAATGAVVPATYEAERGVLEGEWEKLRAQLDLAEARVSRLA